MVFVIQTGSWSVLGSLPKPPCTSEIVASASPTVTSTWPTWRAYSGRTSTTSVNVAKTPPTTIATMTATIHWISGDAPPASRLADHPAYAATVKNAPCAKFSTRIKPQISDSPAAIKK